MSTFIVASSKPQPGLVASVTRLLQKTTALFSRIPHSLIALLARFSVAMTFWLSGQTKIEGLVLDPINGTAQLGVPRISDGALELFRSEYALPLIPPELAAPMAAVGWSPCSMACSVALRMASRALSASYHSVTLA